MSGAAEAARLLRERAASYARDAESLMHESGKGEPKDWLDDWVIMTRMRDELRLIANKMEAPSIADCRLPGGTSLIGRPLVHPHTCTDAEPCDARIPPYKPFVLDTPRVDWFGRNRRGES